MPWRAGQAAGRRGVCGGRTPREPFVTGETTPTGGPRLSVGCGRGGVGLGRDEEMGRRRWFPGPREKKEKREKGNWAGLRSWAKKKVFFFFFCKRFKQIQFEFKFEEFKFKLNHNIKTMQG